MAFENTQQTDLGELVHTAELSQPPNGVNIFFYLISENNREKKTISSKE